MRYVLLSILAACWTGAEPAPPPATPEVQPRHDQPLAFSITIERTPCFGTCPVYSVTIRGNGEVIWDGKENVAALGPRSGHAPRRRLVELERAITTGRFFERGEDGTIAAQGPDCVTTGHTTRCSFHSFTICSDTSSSIITVERNAIRHRVIDAHCEEAGPLAPLEALVDEISNDRVWIGR